MHRKIKEKDFLEEWKTKGRHKDENLVTEENIRKVFSICESYTMENMAPFLFPVGGWDFSSFNFSKLLK